MEYLACRKQQAQGHLCMSIINTNALKVTEVQYVHHVNMVNEKKVIIFLKLTSRRWHNVYCISQEIIEE